MKFGRPFSRKLEKEFAYWILTSQPSARVSLLASFRNNNQQDQASGGKDIQVCLEGIVRGA